MCEGKTKKQQQSKGAVFCDVARWLHLLISYARFIQIVWIKDNHKESVTSSNLASDILLFKVQFLFPLYIFFAPSSGMIALIWMLKYNDGLNNIFVNIFN